MTERCQTKFTEKFDSQNNIIYVGILVGSIAVLYFYRFHFATGLFSYVLGCVACYYGLKSRILHNYVEQWKCHLRKIISNEEHKVEPVKGCDTCGSKDCNRHDSGMNPEPWVGLQIHKQLDLAIEDFYNTILEQFINSWYSKVTLQPFFVDELRHQLRYASASLLRRALKINYSRLITDRLVACALRHYTLCAGTGPEPGLSGMALHPACCSRAAELKYLRAVTDAVMPYLLKPNEVHNSVFHVLVREIFAGWVLLSLADVLADPHVLNTLVVLATGQETMAQMPTTPNYKVEFLETFSRQTDSVYLSRMKLLKVDLELVIHDQEYFYAFMQHLKSTSHIHLLQFYKDIKSFQTKILNPELEAEELSCLHTEACDMHRRYFGPGSPPLPPALRPLADELNQLLQLPPSSVKGLQTSRALYQAARHSHAELEKIMLPKFLHSEEYYRLLLGSRIPTGFHKQMTKKSQEKLLHTALKLGSKIRGALRSQTIDGQVLDCFTNTDISDGDGLDNMDILQFIDSIADDSREQDLSSCKVVLTNVETRLQAPPRRGTVRVFTVAVHRIQEAGGARLWTVERSEHDFHLLRSKLHEFHGDLLNDLPLPSRRDNSPLETLRYKYEDFLQRLLQKSLLQTSELLHLFLTADGDFSMLVQASALSANGSDLANVYQNVAHKLRKEKGQHLESFLKNLLICSDKDRFQALKQGTSHIEEAQEVSEEIEPETQYVEKHYVRNIQNGIFENNFDVDSQAIELSERRNGHLQTVLRGFTQCSLFLLKNIIHCRVMVCTVLGTLLSVGGECVDDAFNYFLNNALCRLLTERRLAHLIRLGHGLLFGKKSTSRVDSVAQRELARTQLLSSIPPSATLVLGPGLPMAVLTAFEIIQNPHLNKQLVYNLLDLCILELFPELSATDYKSQEPKS